MTTVENWGKFSYDAAQIYSKQLGFDVPLDSQKEVSHESIKEQINHVIDAAKKSINFNSFNFKI